MRNSILSRRTIKPHRRVARRAAAAISEAGRGTQPETAITLPTQSRRSWPSSERGCPSASQFIYRRPGCLARLRSTSAYAWGQGALAKRSARSRNLTLAAHYQGVPPEIASRVSLLDHSLSQRNEASSLCKHHPGVLGSASPVPPVLDAGATMCRATCPGGFAAGPGDVCAGLGGWWDEPICHIKVVRFDTDRRSALEQRRSPRLARRVGGWA